MIGRIERKIEKLGPYKMYLREPWNAKEGKLFDDLTRYIRNVPAFTGEMLFKELGEVLVRNRLLEIDEVPALENARRFVITYGGWRMHQCKVRLGDSDHAVLELGEYEGSLVVKATAPITPINGLTITVPMYTAEVKISEIASPELLALPQNTWDFPITLGSDRLLRPL